MINPIAAISLVVAFAIVGAAVLLTRRALERPSDDGLEQANEAEQRYVNGGWH